MTFRFMSAKKDTFMTPNDTPASESIQRKKNHLDLALRVQTLGQSCDDRFYYEPLLSSHPNGQQRTIQFLNYTFTLPLWISSMTGGTEEARTINHRLAKACEEYGLGMGLGSCRPLLESTTQWDDFLVREYMPTRPLFANFGIAQIEHLIQAKKLKELQRITERLEADGLIIHVNPLQEWFQPEGDLFLKSPLETIKYVLDECDLPLIVKEVGQGIGPNSLKELMKLPLAAIEFAAFGGTNFSLIEQQRSQASKTDVTSNHLSLQKQQGHELSYVGHTASEMIEFVQKNLKENPHSPVKHWIVSGGVKSVLDGHYYLSHMPKGTLFGMASSVLAAARESEEALFELLSQYQETWAMAQAVLVAKSLKTERF
jgi:isopentenyl-diphosphate delta-isomerase